MAAPTAFSVRAPSTDEDATRAAAVRMLARRSGGEPAQMSSPMMMSPPGQAENAMPPSGGNPVAEHLFMALDLMMKRGFPREDLANLAQFLGTIEQVLPGQLVAGQAPAVQGPTPAATIPPGGGGLPPVPPA